MERMSVEELNYIKRLIKITFSITKMYSNLAYAEMYSTKKYNEYLSDLEMCLEIEDKIYDEFEIEVEDIPRVMRRIYYQIDRDKDIPDSSKLGVKNRIINYIGYRNYTIPFLSMQKREVLKDFENHNAVAYQRNHDYVSLLVYLLNQKISEEVYDEKKASFIFLKNAIIYENKCFEKELLSCEREPLIEGRKNLEVFNQDEKVIKEIYSDSGLASVKDLIINVGYIPDFVLVYPQGQFEVERNLLLIETELRLLDKHESFSVYDDFCNQIKDIEEEELKQTLKDLLEVLREIIHTPNKYKKLVMF